MSLRIFETDPDAKPKARNTFADDIVGRFRSGVLIGRRPQALSEWRVTTDDPDVADRVAQLYGGTPEEWDTDKSDNLQVLTDAASVPVVIEGASALRTRMALYGQAGPIHICDGAYFIEGHPEDEEVGEACGCPRELSKRKEMSKSGRGPKPDISLRFRLRDDPDLGLFLFSSGSWSLVNDLAEIERALAAADGPMRADLKLTFVEYDTKAGRHVEYHRPEISIKGAA
ncbi:hypothetical protein [Amycolatopsis sp. NPDC059021]|uniref:recombination directionality factor n=1 Tax=Amycolatopsis sp. NPDC059021 TaxID=3346704 RepID=UPI00366CEC98